MYFPTSNGGCRKAYKRLSTSDRHWGHWRWLNCIGQAKYSRAIQIWVRWFGVQPRGLWANHEGNGVRLCLEPYRYQPSSKAIIP